MKLLYNKHMFLSNQELNEAVLLKTRTASFKVKLQFMSLQVRLDYYRIAAFPFGLDNGFVRAFNHIPDIENSFGVAD